MITPKQSFTTRIIPKIVLLLFFRAITLLPSRFLSFVVLLTEPHAQDIFRFDIFPVFLGLTFLIEYVIVADAP